MSNQTYLNMVSPLKTDTSVLPDNSSQGRWWLVSLLLLSPVICLYVAHYVHGMRNPHMVATGFMQYDYAYYLANAREHFDSGRLCLTYDNPLSPLLDRPRIYFQPLILLLSLILSLTGIDPGLLFVICGLLAALVCIRISLAVFEQLYGVDSTSCRLTLVGFVWGGGIFYLSGICLNLLTGHRITNPFAYDPADGWWFLNYGRTLVCPTEAFYHLLVFVLILFILRRQYPKALSALLVLSMSHPFTGIQFIMIILLWASLERYFFKRKELPAYLPPTAGVMAFFHLLYYLIFLPLDQEHASVMAKWTLPWILQAENMIPAYLLVLGLTIWRIRDACRAGTVFSRPENRLLLMWFLVSFLLANHEFLITPRQPIHFARGHIWTPLFLLGVPTLIALLNRLRTLRMSKYSRKLAMGLIMLILVSDNAAWVLMNSVKPSGIYLSTSGLEAMNWLNSQAATSDRLLLISNSAAFNYFAMVYTPLRSWYSHWAVTPFADLREEELKAFFKGKGCAWPGRDTVIVQWLNNAEGEIDLAATYGLEALVIKPSFRIYTGRFVDKDRNI